MAARTRVYVSVAVIFCACEGWQFCFRCLSDNANVSFFFEKQYYQTISSDAHLTIDLTK